MESLPHAAPSKEGMGCWGQTLGKNLLLQWLKQSHVQRVLLLLRGYTNPVFEMCMHMIVAAQKISRGEYK